MKYVLFIVVTFLPLFAFAAPGIPEAFYGTAGASAEIDAIASSTTIASTTAAANGTYGYAPDLFLIPDLDNSLLGSAISFTIDGNAAVQTVPFENGAITNLDLTVAALPVEDADTSTSTPAEDVATSTDQEVVEETSDGSGGGGSGGTLSLTATSSVPALDLVVKYDFNSDGKIDVLDFNDLIAHWGVRLAGLPEDLNGDGVVDLFDLNLFFAHWHV